MNGRVEQTAVAKTLGSTIGVEFTRWVSARGGEKTIDQKQKSGRVAFIEKKVKERGGLALAAAALMPPPFPFTAVEGDGVYEIPVGPVHAGVIEPGHFRFNVLGETVLKMRARLYFTHKGTERLCAGWLVTTG